MMPLSRTILAFTSLALASTFFVGNIVQTYSTLYLPALLAGLVGALAVVLIDGGTRFRATNVKPYYTYGVFVILVAGSYEMSFAVDGQVIESTTRDILFGLNGGLILATVAGYLLRACTDEIIGFARSKYPSQRAAGIAVGIILIFHTTALIYFGHTDNLQDVSDTQFLIRDWGVTYQRAGDYMLVIFMINVTLALGLVTSRVSFGLPSTLLLICILAQVFLLGSHSQLMGSNTGLVTVWIYAFCIFAATITSLLWPNAKQLPNTRAPGMGRIAGRFLAVLAVMLAAFGVGVELLIDLGMLDPTRYRITGYGAGSISSVDNRLDIFESNFWIHVIHSPLLGNPQVDALTTGAGTYAHSFFSVLSHFGVVGLLVFASLLARILQQLLSDVRHATQSARRFDLILPLSQLTTFSLLVLYGFGATFYTWFPFWFAVGFIPNSLSCLHKDDAMRKY